MTLIKRIPTIKDVNHSIWEEYFEHDTQAQTDYNMLMSLYALHRITVDFLENDPLIRDRILAIIKKEQVRLEKKKCERWRAR
jgi:hypothetical protein